MNIVSCYCIGNAVKCQKLETLFQKELERLQEQLEGEKLRQEVAFREQLARRKQKKILEAKRRQELQKRQELEAQQDEKNQARGDRVKDHEAALIQKALQENDASLGGEVIKQVKTYKKVTKHHLEAQKPVKPVTKHHLMAQKLVKSVNQRNYIRNL